MPVDRLGAPETALEAVVAPHEPDGTMFQEKPPIKSFSKKIKLYVIPDLRQGVDFPRSTVK